MLGQKSDLEKTNAELNKRIETLNDQVSFLKQNNTQALSQLENLSVISKQQAESIRRSMDNMGAKDAYIQTLQRQIAYKDSLNMALVMNLKGPIGNLDDEDQHKGRMDQLNSVRIMTTKLILVNLKLLDLHPM